MTPLMCEGSQVQDWQLQIWPGFMNDQFCHLQGRSHHLLLPPVPFAETAIPRCHAKGGSEGQQRRALICNLFGVPEEICHLAIPNAEIVLYLMKQPPADQGKCWLPKMRVSQEMLGN